MVKDYNDKDFITLCNTLVKKSKQLHELRNSINQLTMQNNAFREVLSKNEILLKQYTDRAESLLVELKCFENDIFLLNLFLNQKNEFYRGIKLAICNYLNTKKQASNITFNFTITSNCVVIFLQTHLNTIHTFSIFYDIEKSKESIANEKSIEDVLQENCTYSDTKLLAYTDFEKAAKELNVTLLSEPFKINNI